MLIREVEYDDLINLLSLYTHLHKNKMPTETPEIIGDPSAALDAILRFAKEAEDKKVDLLLFLECFLTGYILSESFVEEYSYDFESEQFAAILKQLEHIVPVLVFGVNEKKSGQYFNSAVVINRGAILGVYHKTHLIDPNELFYTPGNEYPIFEMKGLKYGINICYDAQFPYAAKAAADQGAQLLLSLTQNMLRREIAEYWKDKHSKICVERRLVVWGFAVQLNIDSMICMW